MVMGEFQMSGVQEKIISGTVLHVMNGTGLLCQQQHVTELLPQNYTQVGGVYDGSEIRPQFLSTFDNVQHLPVEELVPEDREPRFFRIK
jgi:hypothetical protein